VLHIQQRLVAHGFAVVIDGWRGDKTTAAIKAFQQAHGLTVDGIVGRFTLNALNEDPS
jgi:peptidoglycan hydrolase-like protein with peptidoglycan-binding domain